MREMWYRFGKPVDRPITREDYSMRTVAVALMLCAGALGLLGCNVESSCNILTAGLYFDLSVTLIDGQAVAVAALWVGGEPRGTSVELECGDQITVNGTVLHRKQGIFVYYEATLAPADTYEFVVTREGEDPHTNTVQTPPAVTILTPADAEEISRQDAFDITWEDNGTGESIDLIVGGNCISDIADQVADNGLYTVNAGLLDVPENQEQPPPDECDMLIALTRHQDGTIDPTLTGRIRGFSTDNVNVWSLP